MLCWAGSLRPRALGADRRRQKRQGVPARSKGTGPSSWRNLLRGSLVWERSSSLGRERWSPFVQMGAESQPSPRRRDEGCRDAFPPPGQGSVPRDEKRARVPPRGPCAVSPPEPGGHRGIRAFCALAGRLSSARARGKSRSRPDRGPWRPSPSRTWSVDWRTRHRGPRARRTISRSPPEG